MESVVSLLLLARAAASHRSAAAVTWNPLDKHSSITLSLGNTAATLSSANTSARGTAGRASGKYYFRISTTAGATASGVIGVANSSASLSQRAGLSDANAWTHQSNGYKLHAGYAAYGSTWDTAGDEIMVAVDFSLGHIWIGKNGAWMSSGDPVAGTSPMYTGVSGTLFPVCSSPVPGSGGTTLAFVYDTPPSGFAYW